MMTLDFEELFAENERLSADTSGGGQGYGPDQYVRMPEGNGTVLLRILPPLPHPTKRNKDGKPLPFLYQATRTHRINERTVHCRRELVNGRWVGECPICDFISWLWRKSDELGRVAGGRGIEESERKKSEAREIRAVDRYYYPVVVRKEQQPNGDVKENVGPKIYSCGKTVHARIIRAVCGDPSIDEKGLDDVTDEKTGRDFKVVKRIKSGPDGYPEYNDSKFLDPSPLGDPDKVEKWLAARPDLATYRKVLSIEDLEFEVDVHRGAKVDNRNKSRFDDMPASRGGNAAAIATAKRGDDDDAPAPFRHVPAAAAASVAPAESTALDQDDFIKRLKDL